VELSTLAAAFAGVLSKPPSKSTDQAPTPASSSGPTRSVAIVLEQIHTLHGYAVQLGLLPPVSSTLVDVRGLPVPVAVGCVLATLEDLRQREVEPSALISEPLTIRAEAHSTALPKCRFAIRRWTRLTDGQRSPLVIASPRRLPRVTPELLTDAASSATYALASPLIDDLVGDELVLPERSLRGWLRGARRSVERSRRLAYWERGGSALPKEMNVWPTFEGDD